MIVGVVAVQGDFAEHIAVMRKLGVEAREIRLPEDLDAVDALIIPGGESTTMRRLFDLYNLTNPIKCLAKSGLPIWGTCAGMILLADDLTDDRPEPLHLMNITVSRNAYGRQIDSFEADIEIPELGPTSFHGVFIRAPAVIKSGINVETLGRIEKGSAVALREDNILVTSFHPELTTDTRLHSFFLSMIKPRGTVC